MPLARTHAVLTAACLCFGAIVSAPAMVAAQIDLTLVEARAHRFGAGRCTDEAPARTEEICFEVTARRSQASSGPVQARIRAVWLIGDWHSRTFPVEFPADLPNDTDFVFTLRPNYIVDFEPVGHLDVSIELIDATDPNPNDNSLEISFLVTPPPPAKDVSFQSLSVSPLHVRPLANLTLQAQFTNSGFVDLQNVRVRFRESEDSFGSPEDMWIGETVIASMPAGATRTTQFVWQAPETHTNGTRHIIVDIDPYDSIEEVDEGDNGGSHPYVFDSAPGDFRFWRHAQQVAEGHSFGIVVERVRGNYGDASVYLQLDSTTATPEVDFEWGDRDGWIHFLDGEVEKRIVSQVFFDIEPDDGEDFYLSLRDPTGGATLAAPDRVRIVLRDPFHDNYIGFHADSITVNEFDTMLQVPLFRLHPRYYDSVVRYRTVDGTARAGIDYESNVGQVLFSDHRTWSWSHVEVRLLYDAADTGSRHFFVELFDFQDARPAPTNRLKVTIHENDYSVDQQNGAVSDSLPLGAGAVAQSFLPALPLLDVAEVYVDLQPGTPVQALQTLTAEVRADSLHGAVVAVSQTTTPPLVAPGVLRFRFNRVELTSATHYLVVSGPAGVFLRGGGNDYADGIAYHDGTPLPDVDLWFAEGQFARVAVQPVTWGQIKELFRPGSDGR